MNNLDVPIKDAIQAEEPQRKRFNRRSMFSENSLKILNALSDGVPQRLVKLQKSLGIKSSTMCYDYKKLEEQGYLEKYKPALRVTYIRITSLGIELHRVTKHLIPTIKDGEIVRK